MPGLDRYVRSLREEARLTLVGQEAARVGLVNLLVNRLEMTRHMARHPQILLERIERPLFVVGLPRSGTTHLVRLLACDEGNRALLAWEAMRPCPPPEPETRGGDPRIEESRRLLGLYEWLVPGLGAVHDMRADAPEECVVVTAHEMRSLLFSIQFDVESYHGWLLDEPMEEVYAAHRRFLALLQSGGVRGERWLLKSPAHLPHLSDLLAVYPDAAIVQTHRDPVTSAVSMASYACLIRSATTGVVDPSRVGRQILEWIAMAVDRSLDLRSRLPRARFCDLRFDELAEDPMGCVRRIYDRFGFGLTAAARARMESYLGNAVVRDKVRHVYEAGAFGIDPVTAGAAFGRYRETFGV